MYCKLGVQVAIHSRLSILVVRRCLLASVSFNSFVHLHSVWRFWSRLGLGLNLRSECSNHRTWWWFLRVGNFLSCLLLGFWLLFHQFLSFVGLWLGADKYFQSILYLLLVSIGIRLGCIHYRCILIFLCHFVPVWLYPPFFRKSCVPQKLNILVY